VRWLGRTGVKVSRVALGTMAFGGDADEATAGAIWRAARDAGVNLIDTADVYAGGRPGDIVGRRVASEPQQPVPRTKAYLPAGLSVGLRQRGRVPAPICGRWPAVGSVTTSPLRPKTRRSLTS